MVCKFKQSRKIIFRIGKVGNTVKTVVKCASLGICSSYSENIYRIFRRGYLIKESKFCLLFIHISWACFRIIFDIIGRETVLPLSALLSACTLFCARGGKNIYMKNNFSLSVPPSAERWGVLKNYFNVAKCKIYEPLLLFWILTLFSIRRRPIPSALGNVMKGLAALWYRWNKLLGDISFKACHNTYFKESVFCYSGVYFQEGRAELLSRSIMKRRNEKKELLNK